MNCWILVLLLLCCGNNGSCLGGRCDCDNGRKDGDCGCNRRNDDCGRNNRRDNDCGCDRRNDNRNNNRRDDDCGWEACCRPEPRFEARPFMFNQNSGCGCEDSSNNSCDR